MFIDSHCHISFPELSERLPAILEKMKQNQVTHALCVSVTLPDFPQVLSLAETHPNIYASVGVHPDYEDTPEPSVEQLVHLAENPRIVAIGETGLDYYRLSGELEWQRQRFRTHIRASRVSRKPLIIHTRSASEDTLRIMREELRNLQTYTIKTEALAPLIQQFLTEYFLDNETSGAQADFLARAELYRGDFRAGDRFIAELQAVTGEDVRRVAQQWMTRLRFTYIGNPQQVNRFTLLGF